MVRAKGRTKLRANRDRRNRLMTHPRAGRSGAARVQARWPNLRGKESPSEHDPQQPFSEEVRTTERIVGHPDVRAMARAALAVLPAGLVVSLARGKRVGAGSPYACQRSAEDGDQSKDQSPSQCHSSPPPRVTASVGSGVPRQVQVIVKAPLGTNLCSRDDGDRRRGHAHARA